ncbi:fluoride efflux transporter FluC [Ectobacillus ponti]|uniref:Fluoride-specific ion channel FluC n=1 Tax=Ectobacillus ponti TaxID=2961894 RepID=A0AA41X4E3_9BACI|nr:CrcB family protein [Ectobacillus ponti]MCP8966978.1 CrcB family protein [Ectobacillus ponti]
MQSIAVGTAGILGALLRYGLGLLLPWTGGFPAATFSANMLGSFLLAFLTSWLFRSGRLSPQLVAGIGTGFIGSFTTFSTFSMEMVRLLESGEAGNAAAYGLGSAAGGLLLAYAGWQTGEVLAARRQRV